LKGFQNPIFSTTEKASYIKREVEQLGVLSMKLRNLSLLAVALLAYGASSARAGFVDTLTPNVLNGYHDSSFELVNFANAVNQQFLGKPYTWRLRGAPAATHR
jgi:hypothetical protein